MRDRKKIKAKHYFELDNRQMIFIFAGFIIVCLFVFTAGVMVGSKMTAEKEVPAKVENKLRAKIKAPSLLEDKKEQKTPGRPKPATLQTPVPAKTVEDILAKELRQDSPVSSKKEPKAKALVSLSPEPKPKPVKQAPLPVAKEAFFVQVASFQNPEDAKRQAAKLKSKGYKVIIVKADIPGKGIWHRVRLGPYKDSSDAKAAALKYEKNEKVSTFVTKGLI